MISRSIFALLIGGVLLSSTDADAQRAREPKPPAHVPSVSSTGQRSGVTAGYVNQLTQNVLPSLVRGPQLDELKRIFVSGARIKRDYDLIETDADIDKVVNRADHWVNNTFVYLNSSVSDYAAERFLFRPPGLAMGYNLPGNHAAGYAARWGNSRAALTEFLTNLDQLMRDPSIYPDDK